MRTFGSLRGKRDQAHLRACIPEGFVHNDNTTPRLHLFAECDEPLRSVDATIRVVRIDDDDNCVIGS